MQRATPVGRRLLEGSINSATSRTKRELVLLMSKTRGRTDHYTVWPLIFSHTEKRALGENRFGETFLIPFTYFTFWSKFWGRSWVNTIKLFEEKAKRNAMYSAWSHKESRVSGQQACSADSRQPGSDLDDPLGTPWSCNSVLCLLSPSVPLIIKLRKFSSSK